MKVVLLCFTLVLSNAWALNPPTPRPCITVQDQQTNTGKTNHTAAADKRGTAEHPLVVKSFEAEKTEKRLEQDRREGKDHAAAERRLVRWTVIVGIATCALVAVGAGQLWMFSRQLSLMEGGVDDARAVAAALPNKPVYRDEMRFDVGTTFETRSRVSKDIRENLNLSDAERDDIQSGRSILWMWVKFTYSDILDARYESAFAARYEPASLPGSEPLSEGTSWQEDKSNKKYSYRRKLPPYA